MRRQCLLFLYRAAALGALAAALALYLVEAHLGLGLIVASEKEVPNLLVNLVRSE